MEIIRQKLSQNKSNDNIAGLLLETLFGTGFDIDQRSIGRNTRLFTQTVVKIRSFWKEGYGKPPPDYPEYLPADFVTYLDNYSSELYSGGPWGFFRFYYQSQGQYFKNARFLFGTASQFR